MSPTARATVLSLLVPAIAAATDGGVEARLDAFHRQAVAQRAAQKLEAGDPRLSAQYPPPDLKGEEVPSACPGQQLQVKVTGTLVPGSLVSVLSDDVVVVREKQSATGWEATVQVRPDVPPGDVLVRVTSPVSEAWRATRLLDIGCQHRWVLDLATGERLTVTTRWPAGANTGVKAEGAWSKGGQVLGTARFTVRGGGAFAFERIETAEEAAAKQKLRGSAELKAVEARAAEAQARVNACSTGPAAQQATCLKASGEQLQRASVERSALVDKALSGAVPRFGCEVLKVVRHGAGLTGTAEGCAGARGPTPVLGTVAAAN